VSSCVGMTLKALPAKGPACERSSARDAGESSAECVSYARPTRARAASRCHPLKDGGAVASPGRQGGGGGASCRSDPVGDVEAVVLQVCSRKDGGCRGWPWLVAAEGPKEAGCGGGGAGAHDRQRVAPGSPVRCRAVVASRAEAESTKAQGQVSNAKPGRKQGRITVLEQRSQAPGDRRIMRCGVICRKVRGQDAKRIVGARGGLYHSYHIIHDTLSLSV